jgi:hypothetical protein
MEFHQMALIFTYIPAGYFQMLLKVRRSRHLQTLIYKVFPFHFQQMFFTNIPKQQYIYLNSLQTVPVKLTHMLIIAL